MINTEEKEILKTGRWFRINPKALKHTEQSRLLRDFNQHKFRNLIVAAGRRSFKTERFAKRLLITECLKDKPGEQNIFPVQPDCRHKVYSADTCRPEHISGKCSSNKAANDLLAGTIKKLKKNISWEQSNIKYFPRQQNGY